MKTLYYDITNCVERIYKLFLDVIKVELEKLKIHDLNNIQALMLYNIDNNEVSVGDLIARGMYQGSNVSYNLKKLIKSGYVIQSPSVHDKRSLFVRLSDKGRSIHQKIDLCIKEQTDDVTAMFPNEKSLSLVRKNLQILEGFLLQHSSKRQ
jgi:DNA-binding MarR family transcriptional regulator